jgi:NADH:ubiquinone oxidoreductase subunit C
MFTLLDYVVKFIFLNFRKIVVSVFVSSKKVLINFRKTGVLFFVVNCLKKHSLLLFKQLLDIWALDFLEKKKRFQLNYKLNSLALSFFLVLRFSLCLGEKEKSLIGLFSSANWLEREVWDLFGVFFEGHFDLRRILTDYGFLGYPLRKDFPLSGYYEVKYDFDFQRVIMVELESLQEYRVFDFSSPWDFHVV